MIVITKLFIYHKDGHLNHIEENVHILFIILGVGSTLIILAAIIRHWWRRRRQEDDQQRQRQERQASMQRRKCSVASCQLKIDRNKSLV